MSRIPPHRACSLVGAGAGLDWLVLVFFRGKHYWLASLDWLKPTSKQADNENLQQSCKSQCFPNLSTNGRVSLEKGKNINILEPGC